MVIFTLPNCLQRMSVQRRYRCRGIASLLLKQAIAFARQTQVEEIFLTHTSNQVAAGYLYDRSGFKTRRMFPMSFLAGLLKVNILERAIVL